LIETAKKRLSLLKITDKQISELEESGKVHPYVNIFSDASGIVTAKRTEHGEYIDAGMVLFDITNLSSVWAIFDAYEADLPYLKVGDRISYTVNAVPDAVFNGRIEFISPIIDDMSRTAKVRLETSNKDLKLKPGMLATALIQNAKSASGEAVILPRTAVLWTGHRSVVYIAKRLESGALNFTLREILLGTNLGDYVSVLSGVSQGEFVVANGVFAIDASAQLAGKKSMMSLTSTQQGGSMNNMTKTAVALAVACSVAIGSEEHNANRQNGANQANVAVSKNSAITKTTLSVQGACVMCKARIESAAKSVSGVKLAEWNLEKKLLTLELDSSQTSLDAVSKAVAAVGHDTEKDKASDEVYNALHECCKYRKS
jgi:Cu(I)/Ag(I) efflux system membrane fusion protein